MQAASYRRQVLVGLHQQVHRQLAGGWGLCLVGHGPRRRPGVVERVHMPAARGLAEVESEQTVEIARERGLLLRWQSGDVAASDATELASNRGATLRADCGAIQARLTPRERPHQRQAAGQAEIVLGDRPEAVADALGLGTEPRGGRAPVRDVRPQAPKATLGGAQTGEREVLSLAVVHRETQVSKRQRLEVQSL